MNASLPINTTSTPANYPAASVGERNEAPIARASSSRGLRILLAATKAEGGGSFGKKNSLKNLFTSVSSGLGLGAKSKSHQDNDKCADGAASSSARGGGPQKKRTSLTPSHASATSLAAFSASSADEKWNVNKSPKTKKNTKTVMDLIERRSWRKLRCRLLADDGRRDVLASSCSCALNERTENALHLACRLRAPVDVIRRLCEMCPDLAVEVDARGRTALHVAVSASARPARADVVPALLDANPGAAWARDRGRRLPLHLACVAKLELDFYGDDEGGGGLENGDGNCVANDVSLSKKLDFDTIHELCQRAPDAINEEDAERKTPIERALEGQDWSVNFVDYLLDVSEWRWRLRKDRRSYFSGGDGNDEGGDEDDADQQDEKDIVGDIRYARWMGRRTRAFRDAVQNHERSKNLHSLHQSDIDNRVDMAVVCLLVESGFLRVPPEDNMDSKNKAPDAKKGDADNGGQAQLAGVPPMVVFNLENVEKKEEEEDGHPGAAVRRMSELSFAE